MCFKCPSVSLTGLTCKWHKLLLRMAPLLGKEGCVSRIRRLQGTLQRGSVTRVPHLLILYHIFNPDRKGASDLILLPASTSEGKFKDLTIHLSSSSFLLSSTDYHHFKERLLNRSPSSSLSIACFYQKGVEFHGL